MKVWCKPYHVGTSFSCKRRWYRATIKIFLFCECRRYSAGGGNIFIINTGKVPFDRDLFLPKVLQEVSSRKTAVSSEFGGPFYYCLQLLFFTENRNGGGGRGARAARARVYSVKCICVYMCIVSSDGVQLTFICDLGSPRAQAQHTIISCRLMCVRSPSVR